MRTCAVGTSSASAVPAYVGTPVPVPSTTAEALGRDTATSSTRTGRPRIARTCNANSLVAWLIIVTMPVSCGRGETSLNSTWSSAVTNSSTPKRP